MIRVELDKIEIDGRAIHERLTGDRLGKFAAAEWHRLYKDYVPMQKGVLYNQVSIGPWEIEHTAPYAHYAYKGEVYGPSYPISEGRCTAGFFSPKNRPKHPTGRMLKFDRSMHPRACAKWDQAAEPVQKPKLMRAMQKFIDGGGLD